MELGNVSEQSKAEQNLFHTPKWLPNMKSQFVAHSKRPFHCLSYVTFGKVYFYGDESVNISHRHPSDSKQVIRPALGLRQ
jgi:hypothetical protein